MIKRFNPDFSLSISHELAYMRETPEGGYVAHGDYATLFSELELVKADRDAQQKRADALAVENAALKSAVDLIASAYTEGEPAGFEIDRARNIETPATDAALAAIRAKEHADFIAVFNEHIKTAGLDDDELVTVRECRDALKHAAELREAK